MAKTLYRKCHVCKRRTINLITGSCDNQYCQASQNYRYKRSATISKPSPKSDVKAGESPSAPTSPRGLETFPRRAIRRFTENLRRGLVRMRDQAKRSRTFIRRSNEQINRWEESHTGLAILLAIGLMSLPAYLLSRWWENHPGQNWAGNQGSHLRSIFALTVIILGFLAPRLISMAYRIVGLAAVPFLLLLWFTLYALTQIIIVLAKFLLLIPLTVISVFMQVIQLWRRIFHTCPSRPCHYRGAPSYGCPVCGETNPKLWPNLYGLLWHYCVNCDAKLPTLEMKGRGKLQRRCGECGMPLPGKHWGRAPERLVAIVGAPGSGKTNFLLMAVNEIINARHAAPLRGTIDDETQAVEFAHEWKRIEGGLPAAKTSEVVKAMLLYVTIGRKKSQLYLYDAPGEEFSSISAMTRQQYFPLLEGFLILVDPLSFETLRWESGITTEGGLTLQQVVNSTLATASAGLEPDADGKIRKRVAVVISKADLPAVKRLVGDVKREQSSNRRCREAIVRWGGENAIRAIEHRFAEVEYFACSPLGRAVERGNYQPFRGIGTLEPLAWVLTGQHKRMNEKSN